MIEISKESLGIYKSPTQPCDKDYRGTDAFSEKESATMRDYLEQIKGKRQIF